MKRLLMFVLAGLFVVNAGLIQVACGHNPPILSPSVAAGITNGLSVLATKLRSQNVDQSILDAITDAQTAITADAAGHTWGQITRELLGKLYSQLSLEVLQKTWPIFAAIEVVLATIGA